jgi:hypothetical protein
MEFKRSFLDSPDSSVKSPEQLRPALYPGECKSSKDFVVLRSRFMTILFLIALTLSRAESAWSWGCEGHQVVALVAQKHLTKEAKARVDQILTVPIEADHLHHFCSDTNLPEIAIVSTWADDIRETRPETASWHFRDIPLGAVGPLNSDSFCPDNSLCVTKAISMQVAVLKDRSAKPEQQKEALVFLVHFVGDLHQPLHCEDNADRGENCVPVSFFSKHPSITGKHPEDGNFSPNLHAIWDTQLVETVASSHRTTRDNNVVTVRDPAGFADQLDAEYSEQISKWISEPVALDNWSWDTHRAAVQVAYGALPVEIPPIKDAAQVAKCSDDSTSTRYLKLDEKIDGKYVETAKPVIKEQLAKAGARLAHILNEIWTKQ